MLATILALTLLSPPPHSCKVNRVVDGDTLVCDGQKVRLLLIDAPESKQAGGRQAWLELRKLTPVGSTVEMEFDKGPRDRYGRELLYLYRNGKMVNSEMVRRGYAVATWYRPNKAHWTQVLAAQNQARRGRAGLWGADGFKCLPKDFRQRRCGVKGGQP